MPLKETIITNLRNAIITGKYKPGERLTEENLCKQFGVSRTPIRETLQFLEKEGLLKIIPHAGARVIEFSTKDVSNIYDILIILEGSACRLACSHITLDQINKLKEYHFGVEKAAAQNNPELFFQLNQKFHWVITESTNNRFLMEMRANFRRLLNRFALLAPIIPGQINATLEEHPKIIDALVKSNPGLAEFVGKEHMENAKKFTLEYLKEQGMIEEEL
jgi:DNA-binding GntR family transcriptional regulator